MSLDKFLLLVKKELTNFLNSSTFVDGDINGMNKAAELLCLASGAKRIRAILVHSFGMPLDLPYKSLVEMAAASELIHVASLLHDDVIDMSSQRRGKLTANIVHGNTIAVLTGDLLYSQALVFLKNTNMKIFQNAIQVVKAMTIAASIEYNERGNVDASIQDWTNIALGKTAHLFSWCTTTPSILKDSDQKISSLFEEVGKNLGLAFQLADDIKDFFASDSLGKLLYSDIQNQNTNYVLIKAMEESPDIKSKIKKLWSNQDLYERNISKTLITELGDQILHLKSFQESLQQLSKWIQQSTYALNTNNFKNISESIEVMIKKIFHSLSPALLKNYLSSGNVLV